jgi:DHA3 family tetracycline resistance protein-like MFS transporter
MLISLVRRLRRPADPARAYYLFDAGFAGCHALAFTLVMVYQVQVVGLTPFQLVIVGTAMEVACFLGEIPTGVIADRYSRRLSVLIGLPVIGVAILLQGAVPNFWAVLVAQAIWGVGWTFISGANQAWITDEVGVDAVQPVLTRGHQLSLALTFVGTAVAGGLGLITLQLPIIAGGVGFLILAAVLLVIMPERHFTPDPDARVGAGWSSLASTFRSGLGQVRRRPLVRWFFIISLLFGLSSEAIDRLWTARILDSFTLPSVFGIADPALWFAIFAMIGSLISMISSLVVNRVAPGLVTGARPGVVLAVLVVVQSAAVITLALTGHLWLAMIALWLRNAAGSVAYPIQATWLNRQLESKSRATVLSMNGQADAIGQVVGGPPLGGLATLTSIPVALIGSAVLMAPAAGIYLRLAKSTDPRTESLRSRRL